MPIEELRRSVGRTTASVLEPTSDNLWRAADCVREDGVAAAPSNTALAVTLDQRAHAAIADH